MGTKGYLEKCVVSPASINTKHIKKSDVLFYDADGSMRTGRIDNEFVDGGRVEVSVHKVEAKRVLITIQWERSNSEKEIWVDEGRISFKPRNE